MHMCYTQKNTPTIVIKLHVESVSVIPLSIKHVFNFGCACLIIRWVGLIPAEDNRPGYCT